MNPLGRGNGAYYPNGGNTAGGSIAINGAKPAFYGQTRCGYGTSINNQTGAGGGGGGDEWKGDQECDAPRPGDKCGRYCCVQVCTCPTLVLPPPKPPLDPNCPDCCDQVENCAQTGGPGFTAADCIKGNKGCIVLGSEYFTECEMKKGRAAKRIGDAEKGKHLGMPYGPSRGWPGASTVGGGLPGPGYEICYQECMNTYSDPAYCMLLCAGMMPPRPLPEKQKKRRGQWIGNRWYAENCFSSVTGGKTTCQQLIEIHLNNICNKLTKGAYDECLRNAPQFKSCLESICNGGKDVSFDCETKGHTRTALGTIYVADCIGLDEDDLFHELFHICDKRWWLNAMKLVQWMAPCTGSEEGAYGCQEACYPCSTGPQAKTACKGDPADCDY